MHATLLIFLAAAWLDGLALACLLAEGNSRSEVVVSGAATGMVVLLAIVVEFAGVPGDWLINGTTLARYLAMFAFFAVLLQLSRPMRTAAADKQNLQRWLRLMPLLVANAAVLACVALGPSWLPDVRTAIATAAGATLAIVLLRPVGAAFLHRLSLTAASSALRGAPLVLLSAAVVALGANGWTPVLPW